MLFVQILCLVGLACAVSILFYSKLLRMLIIGLFSLFIMQQIISIYLTGELIGYQFLVNLHLEDIRGYLFQLSKELVLAVVMFAVLFWVLLRLTELLLSRLHGFGPIGGALIMTPLILTIGLPADGVLRSFFQAYKIIAPADIEFEAALASVGIDPESYVLPNNVEASSGKNIIVISLESLEKGFLSRFPEWTPNLNRLAKEWSITDLEIGPGGTWTAGALYKYQVGMPAFLPGIKGNRIFQKTASAGITGLGNVLEAADYQSYFIMDKVEFAGTADLLNAYGVSTIDAERSFGHYVNTALGLELRDADVFFEAKEQIKAFAKSHRPFALFLSTTDSHMNGIRDPRMEELIPKASNKLQYSVQVLDYLVETS